MDDPAVRSSGVYVVIDGIACPGSFSPRRQEVRVEVDDSGRLGEPLEEREYDRVEKVAVTATWRGAEVSVQNVVDGRAGILVDDRAVAEQAGLGGDQYGGWRGVVDIDELTAPTESVKVLVRDGHRRVWRAGR